MCKDPPTVDMRIGMGGKRSYGSIWKQTGTPPQVQYRLTTEGRETIGRGKRRLLLLKKLLIPLLWGDQCATKQSLCKYSIHLLLSIMYYLFKRTCAG